MIARATMAKAAPAAMDAVAVGAAAIITVMIALYLILKVVVGAVASVLGFVRKELVLARAPMAPGFVPFIGHTITLFKAVGSYPCTWDLFAQWSTATAPKPVRVQIFTQHCVVIADPSTMKRVMSSNLKNYSKDLEFSYAPFLEILGTGLVTSGGDTWRKMRGHISKALRVEILDEIIAIATRAVDRLCVKLDAIKGTGESIDMENEFRLLTLQVIGEAILSLSPEESDELFPSLYLPIMDECNARSLSPWRTYLPTPEWFAHRKRVRQLDAAIIKIVRDRWDKKRSGQNVPDDILERVLDQELNEKRSEVERQLCYEIKTFLLAGHETSAAMLTWTMHELSNNGEATEKIRKESDKVFGRLKKDALPTRESLDTLDYSASGAEGDSAAVLGGSCCEPGGRGGRRPGRRSHPQGHDGDHVPAGRSPQGGPLAGSAGVQARSGLRIRASTRTRGSSFFHSYRARGTVWGSTWRCWRRGWCCARSLGSTSGPRRARRTGRSTPRLFPSRPLTVCTSRWREGDRGRSYCSQVQIRHPSVL